MAIFFFFLSIYWFMRFSVQANSPKRRTFLQIFALYIVCICLSRWRVLILFLLHNYFIYDILNEKNPPIKSIDLHFTKFHFVTYLNWQAAVLAFLKLFSICFFPSNYPQYQTEIGHSYMQRYSCLLYIEFLQLLLFFRDDDFRLDEEILYLVKSVISLILNSPNTRDVKFTRSLTWLLHGMS